MFPGFSCGEFKKVSRMLRPHLKEGKAASGVVAFKSSSFRPIEQLPEVMKMTLTLVTTERLSPAAGDDWLRVQEVGHSLPVGVSLRCLTHGWKVQMVINTCLDRGDLQPVSCLTAANCTRKAGIDGLNGGGTITGGQWKAQHGESTNQSNQLQEFYFENTEKSHVEPTQCLLARIVNWKSLQIPMAQAANSAKTHSLEPAQGRMHRHKLGEHL